MRLRFCFACVAVPVLLGGATPGLAESGGSEPPVAAGAGRGSAGNAPKDAERSADSRRRSSGDDEGAPAAKGQVERNRRAEAGANFGLFMFFLQVLRGPK